MAVFFTSNKPISPWLISDMAINNPQLLALVEVELSAINSSPPIHFTEKNNKNIFFPTVLFAGSKNVNHTFSVQHKEIVLLLK